MHRDIPPYAERVIRDAAIAQRAYWLLLRSVDENPLFKLALIDAHVMLEQELRGEQPYPPPAPDMMTPIAVAVDRALEELRPDVEARIARCRAVRRLGGCGYVQLSLSHDAQMRRQIRKLFKDSELTIAEFAEILGVDETTFADHIGTGKIPRSREDWYRRLISIAVKKDTVVITLRRRARGSKSRRSVLRFRMDQRRARAKKAGA